MNSFEPISFASDDRLSSGRQLLKSNGFEFYEPHKGHLKITNTNCRTVMFYPKTGTIVYKKSKKKAQESFKSSDKNDILAQLKALL